MHPHPQDGSPGSFPDAGCVTNHLGIELITIRTLWFLLGSKCTHTIRIRLYGQFSRCRLCDQSFRFDWY